MRVIGISSEFVVGTVERVATAVAASRRTRPDGGHPPARRADGELGSAAELRRVVLRHHLGAGVDVRVDLLAARCGDAVSTPIEPIFAGNWATDAALVTGR